MLSMLSIIHVETKSTCEWLHVRNVCVCIIIRESIKERKRWLTILFVNDWTVIYKWIFTILQYTYIEWAHETKVQLLFYRVCICLYTCVYVTYERNCFELEYPNRLYSVDQEVYRYACMTYQEELLLRRVWYAN